MVFVKCGFENILGFEKSLTYVKKLGFRKNEK